ncbi:hypothetical protein RIF29_20730 [Crotalaria pallida]|uniref:Uncharacterized protein n=1 Tax=Crotalaria pallida TaxID=3830 RepID=A0AAN9ICQ4_CROPI
MSPFLGVLVDCLCLSCDYKGTHFIVWQMHKFGVQKFWTLLLKVRYQDLGIDCKLHASSLLPLRMYENGDILITLRYSVSRKVKQKVWCLNLPFHHVLPGYRLNRFADAQPTILLCEADLCLNCAGVKFDLLKDVIMGGPGLEKIPLFSYKDHLHNIHSLTLKATLFSVTLWYCLVSIFYAFSCCRDNIIAKASPAVVTAAGAVLSFYSFSMDHFDNQLTLRDDIDNDNQLQFFEFQLSTIALFNSIASGGRTSVSACCNCGSAGPSLCKKKKNSGRDAAPNARSLAQ